MRIFLTGATGFVGSYVLQRLLANAAHSVAILLREESDTWRIQESLADEHLTIIRGDINSPPSFSSALKDFAPEAIVHLAWQGVLNAERNSPKQTTNLTATIELVKLSAQVGAKHWIGLGSQAEYGPCNQCVDEQQPTQPTTLYGTTKLCTCLMAEQLCNHFDLRFSWLRLFSAYGPKDHSSWMIPYLILSLLKGKRPSVTAGEQKWDYIFVKDVAEAIYQTTNTSQAHGIFNLGSGQVYRIREIIEQIRERINPHLEIGFGEVPYRPDQVMHLEADISRLQQLTGWHPLTSLDKGLTETVEWYHANQFRFEHSM